METPLKCSLKALVLLTNRPAVTVYDKYWYSEINSKNSYTLQNYVYITTLHAHYKIISHH